MAEYNNLYQRAQYYDIVFNRDVSKEVDFVSNIYRQCSGREIASVLDLACGPGYHARAFAKRGVRAVGLDLRPEMLDFANDHALAEGLQIGWIAADMRYVRLDNPVDVALNMFDGIDCLLTNEDLLAHFDAIANCLTPGGLYLIDVTHPRDSTFGNYCDFRYKGARDDVSVEIVWATNGTRLDPASGVSYTSLELHIDDHGEKFTIQDSAVERFLLPQEIRLLSECSGVFNVIGFYGDFDLNQPLDNSPASVRQIAILQKH